MVNKSLKKLQFSLNISSPTDNTGKYYIPNTTRASFRLPLHVYLFTYISLAYFWLWRAFVAAGAFSSCSQRGPAGCRVQASHCGGFSVVGHGLSGTGAPAWWLPGCRTQAQQLWCRLVALPRVGSSQTRDRSHVSCIGRWILYHYSTREAPGCLFFLT